MRTPVLSELPPPPPGKTGWPWTVETGPLPPTRPDGSAWPRISIITPSYNQGRFIEETIRSVLLQGYRDLEYMVVDGGSTDDSVAIIRKYARWITYWVSEKDGGQPNAINKGLARVTGEVFNWINSDDLLLPSALACVGALSKPEHAVAAAIVYFSEKSEEEIASAGLAPGAMLSTKKLVAFNQPGIWLRVKELRAVGNIDESLQFAFDYYLVIKYLFEYPNVVYSDRAVAKFRLHPASKTCTQKPQFDCDRWTILHKILADSRLAVLHQECLRSSRIYYWRDKINPLRQLAKPLVLPLRRSYRKAKAFWSP